MSDRKLIKINIVTSLTLQIVTIICGFIVPRIIIEYFGSATNGLISSVNQFLNYIELLEGGLSSVVMATLYKPLRDGDKDKINGIINETNIFFRKIALIFVGYALIVVLVFNIFIQYFFSLTYKILLNTDRKVYIVSLSQMLFVICNTVMVVMCARYFKDILVIKILSSILFLAQPIIYGRYVKNHYDLKNKKIRDSEALKQRWDGFGINLAYFVHTNTDIVVLTLLTSLREVSVYSIYFMVVNALKNLILSISNAITPTYGNILAGEEMREKQQAFERYIFVISTVSTIVFACAFVLLTPFVQIYTNGINDANYNQFLFGVVICAAGLLYCYRQPYISAAYSSNKFRDVAKYAYIEAILNIVLSVIGVKILGLLGVALGTCISMGYRYIAHIGYLKKNIIYRPIKLAVKDTFLNFFAFIVVGLIAKTFIPDCIETFTTWILYGIATFGIVTIIITLKYIIFYRKYTKEVFNKFIH